MESGIADVTSLFIPPKSDLSDVLQPVFALMQEKYPDRVLIVKMHQAEILKVTSENNLINEKLIEKFLTGEMLAMATKLTEINAVNNNK